MALTYLVGLGVGGPYASGALLAFAALAVVIWLYRSAARFAGG